MSNKELDPITVEAQLVQAKILPTRADTPQPTWAPSNRTSLNMILASGHCGESLWCASSSQQFSDKCPLKTCCTSRVSPPRGTSAKKSTESKWTAIRWLKTRRARGSSLKPEQPVVHGAAASCWLLPAFLS